jgi:fatty acid-binding protein DegV
MIGLCTDSTAQVPSELCTRHGIEVVPATVVIDDEEHLDEPGALDAFYGHVTRHGRDSVTLVEPSSGQFAAAYDDLTARGCTEILSLHTGGSLNAARLAAHATAVPVRVVDPGGPGFALSCAIWAAGESITRGASLDQVVTVAERVVPQVGNLFIVGATGAAGAGIELVTFVDGERQPLEPCPSVFDAINSLASRVLTTGGRLRVAVGHSDPPTAAIADALEAAIGEPASVIDVVRYRIGPGAAAQAVPGTVGCYWFPAD